MSRADYCPRCGRILTDAHGPDRNRGTVGTPQYVRLVHTSYGCDTGCCGHQWMLIGEGGEELASQFSFSHPNLYVGKTDAERDALKADYIRDMGHDAAAHFGVPINYEESEAVDD